MANAYYTVLLADEPTGNLDGDSANNILSLLGELNRETNVSVVVVTHDLNISARYAKRIAVNNGRVAMCKHNPDNERA